MSHWFKSWKNILLLVLAIAAAVLLAGMVWGNSWRMNGANRDFRAGKIDQASAVYQEMTVDHPQAPPCAYAYILHNQALAAYVKGQFGPAREIIGKALSQSVNLKDAAAADLNKLYYHAGNAAFQNGVSQGSSPALSTGALNSYQKALQHYKKAMEADPRDMAAKYNYELTQLRVKQNQENQKQQQNNDQSGNGSRQKKERDSQGNNSGDQQKQRHANKQNPGDGEKGKRNSGNQPQPSQGQMTKEEAEALLKMAEHGDQYQAPQVSGATGTPEKDW